MEKYICIHGHFYQPPRENPWLQAIEPQDSAYPYHDWNERITAECYASNAKSRILNESNQVVKIVNNYSKISFNFGPTLLSWLEKKFPEVYQAILQADLESQQRLEGHGNAIAQAYHHSILPLCNSRDKYTQIAWGIRDFIYRFNRMPRGLWLPETAVDLESLSIMAEFGIQFTILSQRQAKRLRKIGAAQWQEVYDGQIDPTMPYVLQLPNGRSINLFFYDGGIAQAVAFSTLLNQGENFSDRLVHVFNETANRPQLAHIATDGETYGHHYPNGNMALTYALDFIENKQFAKIANYSYFLEHAPPIFEVEIFENTSWSCCHGIERWKSACGCNSSKQPEWQQHWRAPLRLAFDWLRDTLSPIFEDKGSYFFHNPWAARNEYIDVLTRRSPQALHEFFEKNATKALSDNESRRAIDLLEMQRYAMMMYTSCGWFFDELSGLETVQVISYAARTVQLAENFLAHSSLEKQFIEKLAEAKSNLKHIQDGRVLYKKIIKKAKNQSYFPDAGRVNGRQRLIIEQVWPELDSGRFAIKRCLHDTVVVTATIFSDGHDEIGAALQFRHTDNADWETVQLNPIGNDCWRAAFTVDQIGEYTYTLRAWVDYFKSWQHNLLGWIEAKQNISQALLSGVELIMDARKSASLADSKRLQFFAEALQNADSESARQLATDVELVALMAHYIDIEHATFYEKPLKITVDRPLARFSSWYEIFPRSLGANQQHGSFQDLINHLPYIANMGFDVLYLPPIHPIGKAYRKGKNNAPIAEPAEPGSPWGIGSAEGGHTAIHPQLGSMADFQQLLIKAKEHRLEIALDLALQCSPDHPYVTEHPQWFKKRPDGSIQYAENPPKKYQDIYPLHFQSEQWQSLWEECLNIVLFWIKQGIKIFRVDNPHTKPFTLWEWLINTVKANYPEVIFLSEAFTRPQVMAYLSKLGFSQSYTYFTWRNSKAEIIEYLTELTQTPLKEYFRPNFWPNTPDILPKYLQQSGRNGFIIRFILAATLSSNYGIYGPAFELCDNLPIEPGSEEYLNSDKYEIKNWNLADSTNLNKLISQVNTIRRENNCLQDNFSLRFLQIDNDQLIAYSKFSLENSLIIIVNLDPNYTQSGWLSLPLALYGINDNDPYFMRDLLSGEKYSWIGPRNYIELNPSKCPAHIFKLIKIKN